MSSLPAGPACRSRVLSVPACTLLVMSQGVELLETRWCAGCGDETAWERPAGDASPEACCTGCGAAVFLWLELDEHEGYAAPLAA